jgi:hypothetical protein
MGSLSNPFAGRRHFVNFKEWRAAKDRAPDSSPKAKPGLMYPKILPQWLKPDFVSLTAGLKGLLHPVHAAILETTRTEVLLYP